jgi:hypothetical protein
MSNIPQNTNVLEKRGYKFIRESKNLSAIDALLFSNATTAKAQKLITERFGETYSIGTLRTRRRELEAKAAEIQKVVTENTIAKQDLQKQTAYVIKTLGQEAVPIMDALIPPDHPQYKAAQILKELINSIVRRSSELYAEIDYLAEHRYLFNVQRLRMNKMQELELTMGLPMRDQADNIRLMQDLINEGIDLHEKMGLKPKFGDPAQNMQTNLGMDDKETENMKRSREMQRRIAEIRKLPSAEQEQKMEEYKRELFPGIADAKYTDIKPDDAKKDTDKNESK